MYRNCAAGGGTGNRACALSFELGLGLPKTNPAFPSNNTQIHAPSSLSPKANSAHPISRAAPSIPAPAPNPASEIAPTPSRSTKPPRPPRPHKRLFHTQSSSTLAAPSPSPLDRRRAQSRPPLAVHELNQSLAQNEYHLYSA